MPINSTHPEYKMFHPMWTKCRDAVEGEMAIKAKGAEYLPMLSGQIANGLDGLKAYDAYRNRALWFGATDRTLTGYVGAIMRKDPTFVVPEVLKPRLENVTGDKQTAVQFVHTLCKELITTGRYGLLVDKSDMVDELAEIKLYYPENILNWRHADDTLVLVVLQEHIMMPSASDEYDMQEVTQLRELRMTPEGYAVRTHVQVEQHWESGPLEFPTFRNKTLGYIPFVFASSDEDAICCSKPPILDLASCNVNHYQLDADYRHGLHFTALPTPVFTGVSDEKRSFFLGSEGAIVLANEQARAFFLEFQGLGLTAIKDAMEERKAQMASLGAQLLSRKSGGRTVETAEAARIQHAGETSLLSVIVGRVEESLEEALRLIAIWEGLTVDEESDTVEVTINRDFIDATLNAQEITAIVQSWQTGGLSPEDLFWNLQRGGVIDPKKSYDEWFAELVAEKTRRTAEAAALAAATAPVVPLGGTSGPAGTAQGVSNGPGAGASGPKAPEPGKQATNTEE